MPRDFIIRPEEVIQTNIIVNYKPTITVGTETFLAVVPNDATSSYIPSIETYYYLGNLPYIYRLSGVYSLKNTGAPYIMSVNNDQ